MSQLKLLVVLVLAAAQAANAGGQNQTPAQADLSGIDQGLQLHPKFDEFGTTLPNSAASTQLHLGSEVQRELGGGESQVYAVTLAAKQFMHLVVEQDGIHVTLTLYGSDRGKLLEVDSPNGDTGLQPLWWVAYRPGQYRVEVSSQDMQVPRGKYRIRLEQLRESAPADRQYIAAQGDFAFGFDVSKRMSEEAQSNGLASLESAEKVWVALKETERAEQTRRAIAQAKRNLGVIYEGGRGVPRNDERHKKYIGEALEWYRGAAERGDAEAETVMGDFAVFGRGLSQNPAQAAQWYAKAAAQGCARAQNNLGFLYFAGLGVKQKLDKAMKWYVLAAEHGNAVAKRNIGVMYRDGLGARKDPATATAWFRKAVAEGDYEAEKLLASP